MAERVHIPVAEGVLICVIFASAVLVLTVAYGCIKNTFSDLNEIMHENKEPLLPQSTSPSDDDDDDDEHTGSEYEECEEDLPSKKKLRVEPEEKEAGVRSSLSEEHRGIFVKSTRRFSVVEERDEDLFENDDIAQNNINNETTSVDKKDDSDDTTVPILVDQD